MSSKEAIDNLATQVNDEMSEEIAAWIEKEGINEEINEDAAEIARIAARNIIDPKQPGLKPFPKLPLDQGLYTDDGIRYMLIQEFLQSAGLNFTSAVLRYESQFPDLELDREQLGKDCALPSYDKTPYLVQIIEEIIKKRNEQ